MVFKPPRRFKLLSITALSTVLVASGLVAAATPAGAIMAVPAPNAFTSDPAVRQPVQPAPAPVTPTKPVTPSNPTPPTNPSQQAPALGSVPPGFVTQSNGAVVDPTTILAYRKATTTPAQVAQRFSSIDSKTVRLKGTVSLNDNTSSSRLVTATVPNGSADAVIQSMKASGLYDGVQLNGLAFPQYTNTPNDVYFSIPLSGTDGSYGLKSGPGGSNFNQVWADLASDSVAPSASVPVAVLDSGFDLTHRDLVNSNVKAGWNIVDNNPDVTPCLIDRHSHGTETVGVIGAQTDNTYDVAGAGYDATVKVYRITDSLTCSATSDAILRGINRAVADGAKIINISFAEYPGFGSYDAVCAAITDATNKGTLVVAAAGNDAGYDPMYPAACPDALSVTATTSAGKLAFIANRNSTVDIAAAGENVAVLDPNNSTIIRSGTSFSAPLIAAAASLLMRLVPSSSVQQIRAALIENARPLISETFGILDVKQAYDALLHPKSGPATPKGADILVRLSPEDRSGDPSVTCPTSSYGVKDLCPVIRGW